jgi:hypothetical protein
VFLVRGGGAGKIEIVDAAATLTPLPAFSTAQGTFYELSSRGPIVHILGLDTLFSL